MKKIGLSLFNPANISRGSRWVGISPIQRHRRFCTFISFQYGVRALIVLIRTYYYKYNLNTIELVIHRFAPLSENNTYEYIAHVQKWMIEMYNNEGLLGDFYFVQPNYKFCFFSDRKTPTFACRCLLKCICRQETNFELTDSMIDDAIKLL